jgi:hypothetical protein
MTSSVGRRIARTTLATMAVLCAARLMQAEHAAQDAHDSAGAVLRTIRVVAASAGGAVTVILEADGPLPEPATGALEGPPRIYLDLKGVTPAPAVKVAGEDALVRRTRVALHAANPVSSRVVIDLFKPSPYRIDASGRAQGRLIVVLGASGSASVAAPSSAKVPAGKTSPSSRQRPATGVDAYAAQVSVARARLQALRPVLASIDRRADEPAGDLAAAAAEFDAVARLLAAIKAPASREATHDLLLRACVLGARASRMRQDSMLRRDPASGWNAASAAAGALMLLDRANSDSGQSAPK